MPATALTGVQAGLCPPEKVYLLGGGVDGSWVDLYDTPTTQAHPVGQKAEGADGSFYRYCKFNGTVTPGSVVSPDLSVASVVDTNAAIDATQGTDQSVAADSTQFRMDNAAYASISENQFAGGYFITTDDDGEGYTYRILWNSASANTDEVGIEIANGLEVAVVAANTDSAILPNPWEEVVDATAATDFCPTGVSMGSGVDADFGWVKTWGMCGVLQDGTIAAGDEVYLSDSVAGAVHVIGGGASFASNATMDYSDIVGEARVGYCVVAGDDTGYGGFVVQLWP